MVFPTHKPHLILTFFSRSLLIAVLTDKESGWGIFFSSFSPLSSGCLFSHAGFYLPPVSFLCQVESVFHILIFPFSSVRIPPDKGFGLFAPACLFFFCCCCCFFFCFSFSYFFLLFSFKVSFHLLLLLFLLQTVSKEKEVCATSKAVFVCHLCNAANHTHTHTHTTPPVLTLCCCSAFLLFFCFCFCIFCWTFFF